MVWAFFCDETWNKGQKPEALILTELGIASTANGYPFAIFLVPCPFHGPSQKLVWDSPKSEPKAKNLSTTKRTDSINLSLNSGLSVFISLLSFVGGKYFIQIWVFRKIIRGVGHYYFIGWVLWVGLFYYYCHGYVYIVFFIYYEMGMNFLLWKSCS